MNADAATDRRTADDHVARVAWPCRLALWMYPRRWRREHHDEVLGVLSQPQPPGAGRLRVGEACSLAGNGALVRVESLFFGWVHTTRERSALVAMVVVCALSLSALIFGEWLPWRAGAPLTGFDHPTRSGVPGLGALPALLGLGGVVLALAGRARAGQSVLALSALSALLTPGVTLLVGVNRPPLLHLGLLIALSVIAAAAPVRLRGRRRIAMIAAVTVTCVGLLGLSRWSGVLLGQGADSGSQSFYLSFGPMGVVSDVMAAATACAVLVAAAVPVLRRWTVPLLAVGWLWWLQALLVQYRAELASPYTLIIFGIGIATGTVVVTMFSRLAASYQVVLQKVQNSD